MILCRAENISRHYSGEPVFEGISFRIETGDRIGLVGPNGAGKSTLARVLLGRDAPDSGSVHVHADVSVAMLEQFPSFSPGQTLIKEAKSAMSHLEHWYQEMVRSSHEMAQAASEEDRKRWSGRYDHYQELLRQHGGYEFDHRVEEVLLGLGFEEKDFQRPLSTFSGGEHNRVLLGKLLLNSPDLMILDEPTNHLDIETTEWLESYLVKQSAAMVIISHDRYFLDATVTRIFELSRGQLTVYRGNYNAYIEGRAERQKVLERIGVKQREAIEHHEEYVRRNKSGQLARQAKSREKMIARLEAARVETIGDIRGPVMGFGAVERTGDIVISALELGKSYERTLFADLSFDVERGQRVGIIGPNGAGKTTLLKILLGEEAPTTGTVKLGQNVRIGYLDQSLDLFDLESRPLEVVRPPWRLAEKDEPFRALLARFGIGADLAEKKLGSLSGGERTRVALARLSCFEFNLLVLDEPTNHLDLWASEALEGSLSKFEGTVLVVSHDRYFLNQVVDRLLYIDKGTVRLVLGNYDRFVLEREQALAGVVRPDGRREEKAKAQAAQRSTGRRRKFPYRKTAEIERDITDREDRIGELEASLNRPEIYKDCRKLDEISKSIEGLKIELEQLLDHWAEAMELDAS